MARLIFVKGDATCPCVSTGFRILPHVVNDIGRWGKGYTASLDSLSPLCRKTFYGFNHVLGAISVAPVAMNTAVVNMCAQHGLYHYKNNPKPISYEFLEICLLKLKEECDEYKPFIVSIHMPRIGCGLARGKWDVVEGLIMKSFQDRDMDIYIYDKG